MITVIIIITSFVVMGKKEAPKSVLYGEISFYQNQSILVKNLTYSNLANLS